MSGGSFTPTDTSHAEFAHRFDDTNREIENSLTLHRQKRSQHSLGRDHTPLQPDMSGQKALTKEDYTIGWVAVLPIERAAALAVLDEHHPKLPMSQGDDNNYSFGRIDNHNIVVTSLPDDGGGKVEAAFVAFNMRRSFPSLQEFLLVGIAGGAPINADVRLGDVVVGTRIHEYDLGKALSGGHWEPKTIQLRPSPGFRMAITALRAEHEARPSRIPSILGQMAKEHPRMERYTSRRSLQDHLFESGYRHPQSKAPPSSSSSSSSSSSPCDNCDRSKLIERKERYSDDPVIHYGIIASGDRVIKDAETRDKLAQRYNALCFETEAAGFIEGLRCLVIRSICNYADSHKNDQWQRYAAATAAAHAKELLCVMAGPEIRGGEVDSRSIVLR